MEPLRNELLDKLNEQESLFRQMLILAQDQVELLKMGQKDEDMVKRLLEMLDQRQQLIDRIDRLDEAINDLRKKDLEAGSERPEFYIDKVNIIRNIINSIQANDNKCRQLAQAVLNGIGDKVTSARENKKAYQAYTSNAYHDAWFFDKKK